MQLHMPPQYIKLVNAIEIHLWRPLHLNDVPPAAMSPSPWWRGRIIVVRDMSRSSACWSLISRHGRFRLSRVQGELDQPVEQECARYAPDDDASDRTAAQAVAGATAARFSSVLAGFEDGSCERGREFLESRTLAREMQWAMC